MKKTLPILSLGLALLLSGRAHAGLVYDNGPINGSIDAWEIDGSNSVTDSFTVSQSTVLQWATAGLWTSPGSSAVEIDWSVGTTPYGSDVSSGVSLITNSWTGDYGYGYYPVSESGFAVAAAVTAGTYYLTLTDASTLPLGNNVYWDENDGPSSAEASGVGAIGSESFQLYDSIPLPVPDAAPTAVMLAAGVLALAAARRRLFFLA